MVLFCIVYSLFYVATKLDEFYVPVWRKGIPLFLETDIVLCILNLREFQ